MCRHEFSTTDDEGIDRNFYNFIGIGIEAMTYNDLEFRIDSWLKNKNGRSHHVACLNAYCVTLASEIPQLAEIYNSADAAGADGMPFVRWIRRFTGRPCDRLYAPDILMYLADRAAVKEYRFYLYGGHPDVLLDMESNLRIKFPHINIVGSYSPPFKLLTEQEDDEICNRINSTNPDLVIVGLGTPKQDYWISTHIEKIRGAVLIASGATFDFFGGRIKLAPEWIRESGFEWLYRLFSPDFKRLFRRYTTFNIIFLWKFFLQILNLKKFPSTRKLRDYTGTTMQK